MTTTSAEELSIEVACRTPFDWNGLIDFLRPRAIPGVESISENTYSRATNIGRGRGIVTVEYRGEGKLAVRMPRSFAAASSKVAARVAHLFDAAADPDAITAALSREWTMGLVARGHPGVRVPGCWDAFELAVRAVVGQQVSVAGASTLIGRIAAAFGTPVKSNLPERESSDRSHRPSLIFPTADRLAGASLDGLGFTTKRAGTILALARAVADRQIVLEPGPSLDETVRRLTALPGIGPWTAHYIAMRAFHETDAFPSTDLWLQRGMGYGAQFLERVAEDWRPYRAYAAMLIWRTV